MITLSKINYMNTFKAYWVALSAPEKNDLANRLETSVNYLTQVAHGHRKTGKHLMRLMCFETGLSKDAFEVRSDR